MSDIWEEADLAEPGYSITRHTRQAGAIAIFFEGQVIGDGTDPRLARSFDLEEAKTVANAWVREYTGNTAPSLGASQGFNEGGGRPELDLVDPHAAGPSPVRPLAYTGDYDAEGVPFPTDEDAPPEEG